MCCVVLCINKLKMQTLHNIDVCNNINTLYSQQDEFGFEKLAQMIRITDR